MDREEAAQMKDLRAQLEECRRERDEALRELAGPVFAKPADLPGWVTLPDEEYDQLLAENRLLRDQMADWVIQHNADTLLPLTAAEAERVKRLERIRKLALEYRDRGDVWAGDLDAALAEGEEE